MNFKKYAKIMSKLYYVHDPMCSWCWGFRETWSGVESALSGKIEIEYVVGGLAPDSDEPMDADMQTMLQNTWRTIQQRIPGVEFNFDFWSECVPRRSTYPACRAVLAAKQQGTEKEMILAIQKAYYLNARNPSDHNTLVSLAQELAMDKQRFESDYYGEQLNSELLEQIDFASSIGAQGFPSLIVQARNSLNRVRIDYNSVDVIVKQLL